MGRLIIYIIILLIQLFIRVIIPFAGKSSTVQSMNSRVQALKSDLKRPKRKKR